MQINIDVKFEDNVRALVATRKFVDFRNITICRLTNLDGGEPIVGFAIHNPTDYNSTEGRRVALARALHNTGLPKSLRRLARAAADACPTFFD